MDIWSDIPNYAPLIIPVILLLARVGAFVMVLPLFGWNMIPMVVRAGIATRLTVFLACTGAMPPLETLDRPMWAMGLLVVQEILLGVGLGLAANLMFQAVQAAGKMVSLQMGLSEAGIIDPVTGEETESIEMFLQITFALLFLAGGGHHLLLGILSQSFGAFPVAAMPDTGALADLLVTAGSDMLVFMLRLAAPTLAAFLVVTVALGVLARALPEINVLFLSLPIRVGMGVLMAAALVPTLGSFSQELGNWLHQNLGG